MLELDTFPKPSSFIFISLLPYVGELMKVAFHTRKRASFVLFVFGFLIRTRITQKKTVAMKINLNLHLLQNLQLCNRVLVNLISKMKKSCFTLCHIFTTY